MWSLCISKVFEINNYRYIIMSLGISVNESKVGALVAYLSFLMPGIQLRKLIKLVYLIDEESVRQRAIPLTWLDYYAWKKGPVAPEVYAIKEGALGKYVTCQKGEDEKWRVNAVKQAPYLIDKDMMCMSQWEQDLIDGVVARYRDMDADALTDETHVKDSLWSQVVMENGIDFESCAESDCMIDLNRLNTNEESRDTYEDALDAIYMQSLINQAQC